MDALNKTLFNTVQNHCLLGKYLKYTILEDGEIFFVKKEELNPAVLFGENGPEKQILNNLVFPSFTAGTVNNLTFENNIINLMTKDFINLLKYAWKDPQLPPVKNSKEIIGEVGYSIKQIANSSFIYIRYGMTLTHIPIITDELKCALVECLL